MRAQELHQTAAYLRERYAPPEPMMTPGKYVSHEAMHALADALDRTGDDVAETAVAVAPEPDEEYRRTFAIEQAVKAGLGFGGPDDLARAAGTLVAFLRDGTTQPDPHLGQAKGADRPDVPEPQPWTAGAPGALHEAIDRAWRSIREVDSGTQVMDDDEDEEVLEQLRQLGDAEIARTGFTLGIVRALAQSVRADRGIAQAAAADRIAARAEDEA